MNISVSSSLPYYTNHSSLSCQFGSSGRITTKTEPLSADKTVTRPKPTSHPHRKLRKWIVQIAALCSIPFALHGGYAQLELRKAKARIEAEHTAAKKLEEKVDRLSMERDTISAFNYKLSAELARSNEELKRSQRNGGVTIPMAVDALKTDFKQHGLNGDAARAVMADPELQRFILPQQSGQLGSSQANPSGKR